MKNERTTNRVNKAIFISLMFIIIAILSAVMLSGCKVNIAVADSSEIINVEDYTDSDDLLIDTGKSIQSFANEIKERDNTVNNSELLQIVPEQYLRFQLDGYVAFHNGKEYGYYIKHRLGGTKVHGFIKLIDVIIIDFEYNISDTVFTAKAKVLIQETFEYKNLEGVEHWLRITESKVISDKDYAYDSKQFRKTYYISNPSFLTIIQNENEANYGDIGYNKKLDNGAIIYQTRLNYQGVKVIDDGITSDEALAMTKGALTICGDIFVDYIANKIPVLGEIVSVGNMIVDLIKLVDTTADAFSSKEVAVPCNRESDIFQEQSKNAQRNSNSLSYSRVSLVSPESMVLASNTNDGFVSCTTLLNDSTCATRLHQVFEYDIYSSDYLDVTKNLNNERISIETGERNPFYAYRKEILFQNQSNSVVGSDGILDYYLLEGGERKFIFHPNYSGEYNLQINNNTVQATVDGKKVESGEAFYVDKTRAVQIVLSSVQNYSALARINLSQLEDKKIVISFKNDYISKFIPSQTGVYLFDGNGCNVKIYDESGNIIIQSQKASAALVENKNYYILYENNSSNSISVTLSAISQEVYTLESEVKTNIVCQNGNTYCYGVNMDVDGQYIFVIEGVDGNDTVKPTLISKQTGEKISFSEIQLLDGLCVYKTNGLKAGDYFISLLATQNANIQLEFYPFKSEYKWILDGKQVFEKDCISRGVKHILEIRDNNNNTLTNRYPIISGDYVDYVNIVRNGNVYELTISEDATLYNDSSKVNPHCEIRLYNGYADGIQLCVTNNLTDLKIKNLSLLESGKIGFMLEQPFLKVDENAVLNCKYNYDGGADKSINIRVKYYKSFMMIYLTDYIQINGDKINNLNIAIDSIKITNSRTLNEDVIYNRNKYPQYKNIISINSVTSGVHFESGNGTAANPYVINNIAQFNQLSWRIKNGVISDCFILKEVNFWGANCAPLFDCTFDGVLDGENRKNNFEAGNEPFANGDIALFKRIGTRGIIRNMDLYISYVASLKSKDNSFGGFAIENYGRIENSKIAGAFRASQGFYGKYVGGIVARNHGIISNCAMRMSVSGGQFTGGIAGYSNGRITGCSVPYSQISLYTHYTDNDFVGGIVGKSEGGAIADCTFSGEVYIGYQNWESRSYSPYVGGICGARTSSVSFTNNVMNGKINVDKLNPDVNWLYWFTRKHFNQRRFVNNIGNVI